MGVALFHQSPLRKCTKGNFALLPRLALFDSPIPMPVTRIAAVVLPILLGLCAALRADTVFLKSGEKLEGKVLRETEAEVTMNVQVTATIKDERVIKREEIEKMQKVQPEEEAWVALGNFIPGTESLERDDYDRVNMALQYFITNFPKSAYVPVAKERLDKFIAEQKRVNSGEVKLEGQWLSKDRVKEERIQVGGRILLNRMKRAAAAGQLTEAMANLDQMEKSFPGAVSYPEAVELARRVLPSLKAAVEQRHAQLKRRVEDEKQRLATSKGTEHAQLDALIKKERATTEATIAASERAGVKWLPLQPANERSFTALTARVTAEMTRLNGLPVEKMQESAKAAQVAAAALSAGNLFAAETALKEATSAWPANELAKRTQLKLADAKKSAPTPKPATPTPAPTLKPKSSKSAATPAPAAPAVAEEVPEAPFFKRPSFFIMLAVVVAFGAVAGKMIAKSRANPDNVLDK